jgi:hypothetical protein
MTKYKVIGDKLFDFYVDVEAENEAEALDAARDLETHLWQPIDNGRTIQPYDVELIQDKFVQTELDISDKSEEAVG